MIVKVVKVVNVNAKQGGRVGELELSNCPQIINFDRRQNFEFLRCFMIISPFLFCIVSFNVTKQTNKKQLIPEEFRICLICTKGTLTFNLVFSIMKKIFDKRMFMEWITPFIFKHSVGHNVKLIFTLKPKKSQMKCRNQFFSLAPCSNICQFPYIKSPYHCSMSFKLSLPLTSF